MSAAFFMRIIPSQQFHNLLQPHAVRVVEGGQFVAVDVEDGGDGAVGAMDGDDDLAAGGAAAGDVSWESLDVGDDDGFVPGPCRPTNAFPERDVHAGDGTLEGAEDKLARFRVKPGMTIGGHAVETGPPETEGFVQDGGDVRHLGDRVALPFQQGGQLAPDQVVLGFLRHITLLLAM